MVSSMRSMARLRHSSSSTASSRPRPPGMPVRTPSAWVVNVSPLSRSRNRMWPSSGEVALPWVHDVEYDHFMVLVAQVVQSADDRGEVAEQSLKSDDHAAATVNSAAWCRARSLSGAGRTSVAAMVASTSSSWSAWRGRQVGGHRIGVHGQPHRVALLQAPGDPGRPPVTPRSEACSARHWRSSSKRSTSSIR